MSNYETSGLNDSNIKRQGDFRKRLQLESFLRGQRRVSAQAQTDPVGLSNSYTASEPRESATTSAVTPQLAKFSEERTPEPSTGFTPYSGETTSANAIEPIKLLSLNQEATKPVEQTENALQGVELLEYPSHQASTGQSDIELRREEPNSEAIELLQPTEDLTNSFARIVGEANQRANQALSKRDEYYNHLKTAREQGADLRRTLLEQFKPVRDEEREKKLRNIAKMQALGNFLTAIAGGVAGLTSGGYVPVTGNNLPLETLRELNRVENDYLRQDRAYRDFALRNNLQDLDRDEALLLSELNKADAEYNSIRKELNALELAKARSELSDNREQGIANRRLEILDREHDYRMERMNTEHNQRVNYSDRKASNDLRVARGKGQVADGHYSFINDSGSKVDISPAESSTLYGLGVRLGLIPREGSKILLTETTNDGSALGGERTKTREVSYSWDKLSNAERTRLMKQAYDAYYLKQELGASDEELREYFK